MVHAPDISSSLGNSDRLALAPEATATTPGDNRPDHAPDDCKQRPELDRADIGHCPRKRHIACRISVNRAESEEEGKNRREQGRDNYSNRRPNNCASQRPNYTGQVRWHLFVSASASRRAPAPGNAGM